MDPATERRATGTISAWLAGLQAGMMGAIAMLAWLGISAEWHNRSFWSAENLMASAFWGPDAVRSGFGFRSVAGVALYLLIYSLLGAMVALVVRDRVPPLRALLVGILFGLGWYYLSFHWIYEKALPLVALLHVERQTLLGHLLYGAFVGRYPAFLPKSPEPVPPADETVPEMPAEIQPESVAGSAPDVATEPVEETRPGSPH